MAEIMPDNFAPPERTANGGGNRDLAEAAELARQHPGRWVRVHEPKAMKVPSGWCSEVRLGQKKSLQRDGEVWEASYEESRGTDGERLFTKYLRLKEAPTASPSSQ